MTDSFRDENPYESPQAETPIKAELAEQPDEPSLTWMGITIAAICLLLIAITLALFSSAMGYGWGAK